MSDGCPHHPDVDLVEDHRAGDMICPECGLVVGDRLVDVGTEWRSFSNETSGTDPSRVGAPENAIMGASGLSTTIAVGAGSSDGDQRLANAQRRSTNNTDRQMAQGMQHIREMSDKANFTRPIQDRAAQIFRQILDEKTLKGKNIVAKAAACLYIGCRQEEATRTIKEIIAIAGCSQKEVKKCYKLIIRTMENNLQLITSDDFMNRFCSNLGLPYPVQRAAIHIAKLAKDLDLIAGRSPISVAAAAIYMASQASSTKKTAKEVGEITGAAEVTVKQCYRLLRPEAARLFPDNFVFDTPIDLLPS